MSLKYYLSQYAAGGGDLPIIDAYRRVGQTKRTYGLILNYNPEFKCWDQMVKHPPAWGYRGEWVMPFKDLPPSLRRLFKQHPDAEYVKLGVTPGLGQISSVVYPPGPQLYEDRLVWRWYADLLQDEDAQRDYITEAIRLLPATLGKYKPRQNGVVYVARRCPSGENEPKVPVNIGLLYFSEYTRDFCTADLPKNLQPLPRDLQAKNWKPRPYLMP